MVYHGEWELATEAVGPPDGPKEFDIELRLQTPFAYHPSHGNLLIDMIWHEPIQLIPIDTHIADSTFGGEWISSIDGNTEVASAAYQGYGGFVELTFALGPLGDFDGDGVLDAHDIDLLSDAVRTNSTDAQFDLNQNGQVDAADRDVWVHELKGTYFGDADLDGQFNTADLVATLASGTYEKGADSTWKTGDFDGDGFTGSSDLVIALADGGYELGPRAAATAIPEPTGFALCLIGWVVLRRKP